MVASEATVNDIRYFLVSDRAGATALTSHFDRAGIAITDIWPDGRAWAARAVKQLKSGPFCLILVPSGRMGKEAVKAIHHLEMGGAPIVVWSACLGAEWEEQWIVEQLLGQHSAILLNEPEVLTAVCRLLPHAGPIVRSGVQVRGSKSSLTIRLARALNFYGIEQSGTGGCVLQVDGKVGVRIMGEAGSLGSPLVVAKAIQKVIRSVDCSMDESEKPPWNKQALELILEPPRRVLSETVSKRILTSFGMRLPKERLCQSPSEAARFAVDMEKKVVLKLVKPQLEDKAQKGAVILDLEGRAAVRRAAQQLEGLGMMLGPPPALGLLTVEQVEVDTEIWLEMVDHSEYGRLVRGGVGNIKGTPQFVFQVPAAAVDVYRGLYSVLTGHDTASIMALSRGISDFCAVVDDLKGRIERAEIHPMAAIAGEAEPLVLDALFEIAD